MKVCDIEFLCETNIGKDFLRCAIRKDKQPSIDAFLDYRNSLTRQYSNKPHFIYQREIKATDLILTILNNQKYGNY
jgi:hypothetical protein